MNQDRVRFCARYTDNEFYVNNDCLSLFSNNIPTTRTDLLLSLSFAPTAKLILHSNVQADISGDSGSSVSIDMTYQL